jgi:two-component system, LytTR family, sensor kinase
LNSISALAGSNPDEARKMIHTLSDFLRGTLNKEEQSVVSLKEEVQHLQLYLDIEKVRFGHRLKTEINCDEPCLEMKLPQLILQPIVENAIKFGLYDTTEAVTILIHAQSIQGQLQITVQNPFDPSTSKSGNGTGFGLRSIQRRLYLLYARNDLLETKDVGSVFTTIVKIPQ